MRERQPITADLVASFAADFRSKPERRTLMNAIVKNGVNAVAVARDVAVSSRYSFSHEIPTGKVTNQKKSGRCWLFAGLNTMRVAVARKINAEDVELSQAYLMFWDKLEKANYFLENILETLDAEQGDRTLMWLLANPVQDGGQWDMFVDLVRKYGVCPKDEMPESFHSSESAWMNRVLTVKLREDAARLREAHRRGESGDALTARKGAMLGEIYRMLCMFLGEPPAGFDFEYRDKENNFHRDAGLTPLEFFRRYVDVNVDDFVSVINAPTADKPYGKTYTVKYLGNVVGGKGVLYLNAPVETLKQLTLAQLRDGEPVWFGCDMGPMIDREAGIMAEGFYDYAGALDTPFAMTKAERLDYGESCLTHAMVFTGANVVGDRVNRWKVENSWGKEVGKDGYFVMDDRWFEEYLYQIVVNKKYLSEELRRALEEPPVVLPPWDPMGSLAL